MRTGLALVLLLCCSLAKAEAATPERIDLQLQWRHQFEFAGFYAAIEQGYYREAGLEVRLHEFDPAQDPIEAVLSGRRQFGIWGAQLISERLRGTPIQLVANYYKRSPLVILTRPDIRLPSDLRGRRLMVPIGDIDTVSYQLMFRQFGLRSDEMVIVPHSFGVDEFIAGEVDAMSAFLTDQPFFLRRAGVDFNVLDPSNYGAELYDLLLFTATEYAQAHPDTVRAFRDASRRGWEYALEHPEHVIELIQRDYNSQQRSREALQFEAVETAKVMLPRVYPVGSIDTAKLRRMAELYVQLGEAEGLERLDGFVFDADPSSSVAPSLDLTAEERDFLAAHPVLRVSNELDWPPFDFYANGAPQGYSIGLLRKIGETLGLQLQFVQGGSWSELVDAFCAGNIDLLHPTDRGERVEHCGHLSAPIIRETSQFLTRRDFKPVQGIVDLFGHRLASPAGWEQTALLQRLYGDRLELVQTQGIGDAIEAVRDGRADATTDLGSSLHYRIARAGYTNLHVQGIWDESAKGGEFQALYIASRRDWPLLAGLINKALAAISTAEKRQLQAQWLDLEHAASALEFSPAERAWLSSHRRLRVGNETDYPPFDFAQAGSPRGYSIELLNLLAKRIGIELDYVTGPSWTELLAMHREKRIDLLHSLFRTPDREVWAAFSQPYLRIRPVYVTRKGEPDIGALSELDGRVVAVGDGWAQDQYLARHHPAIRRLLVNNVEAMLDAVSSGRADATVESEPTLRYWIHRKGLTDLKIAGWAREMADEASTSLHFMAQAEDPELISILNKALNSLSPNELGELQAKWLESPLQSTPGDRIRLSAEEARYLADKATLRICGDPASLPYEGISADGQHEGIAADLAALMSERLQVAMALYPTSAWSESLQALRERRCDLLLLATDLPSRREHMDFTRPYMIEPLVVATRANEVFVRDAAAIGDRPVGIVRGYSYAELLQQRYPAMRIIAVQNVEDGLSQVRDGKLWGFVGSIPSVAYTLAKQRMFELKIAGKLDIADQLSVASRNDEPLLHSIMQKTVDAISEDERRGIVNRWVAVRYDQGVDYALLWKAGLAAALVLIGIGVWNRKLARFNIAIQRAQSQTQNALDQVGALLDNSGQGFLAFGADMLVEPGYSRECRRMFAREQLDRPLPELLAPEDRPARELLAKTLPRLLTETDTLRRQAYHELLPKDFQLNQHHFRADYRPLTRGRMMLVLTDVTAEHRLRERLAHERQRLEFIVNALEAREDLLELLRDFDHFRSHTLPDLLSFERDPAQRLNQIYRQLHTFKSLFAQASLPSLPDQLHALEQQLAALRSGSAARDSSEIKRVLGAVDLSAALERDLAILREALGESYFRAEKEVRVASALIDALAAEASATYGADSRIVLLIQQLRYEPLSSLLEVHFRPTEQLAKRQGKALHPLHCEGPPVPVDPEQLGPFCKSLVHVFRNAIDHGIEDADDRLLADKDEVARIRCQYWVQEGWLHLQIEDDGRGLDLSRLRSRALDLQLIDDTQSLDDEAAAMLIFEDGLSTREAVSTVSGRGVGLAAVRAELQRVQGRLRLRSTPGAGCCFEFQLPYTPPLSQQRLNTPLQHAAQLLEPLPRVMQVFCESHLGLPIRLDSAPRPLAVDELYAFTAVIEIASGLDAVLGISIEQPLLLEMTRRFDREFAEDELAGLADSVGAEIANTVVGNATVYYTHLVHHVAMGTPRILPQAERRAVLGAGTVHGYHGQAADGGFVLFCLLNKEIASEQAQLSDC